MTVFRRKRVGFPFSTVGADDPVRPRKMSVFYGNPMRIRIISAFFAVGADAPANDRFNLILYRPPNGNTPPPQTRLRGFFCPCGAALGKMAHESVQRFEFGRCIYIYTKA
jgi:hypothetical protein